jgi:TolB-like protein/DNA-binding winged helix-turn-helix (wHTH) protein/cytochrome c-type biogenesis protein CcmH/NrfG
MPAPPKSFTFGPFQLDADQRVLLRDGKPVALPPKAMIILAVLVENHGKLVEREELMRRAWPNVFVEDGNLTVNVFALRKALAEGLCGVSPIETIPKRGYRFTYAVSMTDELTALTQPSDEGSVGVSPAAGQASLRFPEGGLLPRGAASDDARAQEIPRIRIPVSIGLGRWKNRALAGVAIGFIGVLAAGVLLHFKKTAVHGPAPRNSLAVLPFQNLTGKPTNDYLADSLTEEMITRFARDYAGELRVIARDSAMSYAGKRNPLSQIAAELRVQYVVQGTVRSEGNHIRVAAQLIRASDQTSLWADSYDGDANRLLEFEDSVAQSVARELSLRLLARRAADNGPRSYSAYDGYLHGLYFLSRRSKTSLEQALQSFAAATISDPHYARAYAGLAVTYNLMGAYSWVSPGYAHSFAKAAAAQALAADPSLGEAHAALGYSMWFYEWNAAAAEEELRRAIQLNPDNADAHHWYSQVLMTSGRFTEAEQEMHSALELDPRSLILRTNLGWLHYFERHYPLAIEEMQSVVREDPDFVTAHYKLWEAYSVQGDAADAWRECRQLIHLLCSPENEQKIVAAYQRGGYSSALKGFVDMGPADYAGSYVDASRYMLFAGNKTRAMDFLERAYQEKDGWMIFVPIDPSFDSLRADARFGRLMLQVRPRSVP